MARGMLYSTHTVTLSEEFAAYLRAKERYGDDENAIRKEMEEILTGSLGDWALDDYLAAMFAENSKELDDLNGRYTAYDGDTTNSIATECEWFEDAVEWQDDFVAMIKKYDGDAIRFNDGVYFRMSQAATEKWFERQYENLQKLVSELTLTAFTQDVWDLRNAISGVWTDAMLVDGGFYPLDDGIRRLDRDRWYAVSNAMLMH